jgi:predicted Zn-dependent protease
MKARPLPTWDIVDAFDTWGIGASGRSACYRLSLTHVAEGESGGRSSPSIGSGHRRGCGVAPTPWRAVQRAAWATLRKSEEGDG